MTWVDEVREELIAQHPGLKLALYDGQPGYAILSLIVVPVRSKGVGTKVMSTIIAEADEHATILALTPTNQFGSNLPRLKQFVARFGFVPNKGRRRDFNTTEDMIRLPLPRP